VMPNVSPGPYGGGAWSRSAASQISAIARRAVGWADFGKTLRTLAALSTQHRASTVSGNTCESAAHNPNAPVVVADSDHWGAPWSDPTAGCRRWTLRSYWPNEASTRPRDLIPLAAHGEGRQEGRFGGMAHSVGDRGLQVLPVDRAVESVPGRRRGQAPTSRRW
jgi:hypothetical protein